MGEGEFDGMGFPPDGVVGGWQHEGDVEED
jgi:hypothetical protein